MTSDQVTYILSLLDYNTEVSANRMGYAPLSNNFLIDLAEDERLYSDIKRYRFKFDSTNELLYRTLVREYSHDTTKVPSHGKYDIYQNEDGTYTVYEYMTDSGSIMQDYYSYSTIVLFAPLAGKINVEN